MVLFLVLLNLTTILIHERKRQWGKRAGLHVAAGRDSFQPTHWLWRAQWPARSGLEDERVSPSILTVALCEIFKACRVTTCLNGWRAAPDLLQRAFQIAAERFWLPKATGDENDSAAQMCLRSCVCESNFVFSLLLCGGSAATLEQPAPQQQTAAVHVLRWHFGTACRFPLTNRWPQRQPANIWCGK